MSIALVIQRAKRLLIIFSSVTCQALLHFSTLSYKFHDFLIKKGTEYETCVLIFFTVVSKTFVILRRNDRDMIVYGHGSSLTF